MMTLRALAAELEIPHQDLFDEVVRRGAPWDTAERRFSLVEKEVALLRKHFADRSRSRRINPLMYRPSPTGKITFETYERIPPRQLDELTRAGFLPSRRALAQNPDRDWPQILGHFRHLRDLQQLAQGRRSTDAGTSGVGPSAPGSTARSSSGPQVSSPREGSKSQHVGPAGPRTSSSAQPDHVASSPLSMKGIRSAATTNTALIPPKPASVAQLQSRTVVGLLNKEVEGGKHTGVPPEPAFRTYRTTVSAGSSAVADLQETLREFHPRMYATFFDQFRDALEVDRRVVRTMGPGKGFSATDLEHIRIMSEICEYSFGIFAYWEMGSKIGRRSRNLRLPSANKVKAALMNLRPMYKGVLTDLCHGRFVFWRVGDIWDLVEVRFDDVHDWLDGLAAGEYVPLTTHHIPLGNSRSFVTPTDLSNRDQDIVKFMSEVAQNLRQGVLGVRGRKATNGSAAVEPQRAGTMSSSGPRTLGYRPENTWLVPITITDGQVDTTLDEDFFSTPDDKKPHQVRSFYRRPKGSSPNAPRTEFVNGHVRGGRGVFADLRLLPAVTINRR